MIGRFVRLLVGLAVLYGAVDLWNPARLPYAAAVKLGDLESLRTVVAAVVAVIGLAFLIAAVAPRAKRRKRAAPVALMGDL